MEHQSFNLYHSSFSGNIHAGGPQFTVRGNAVYAHPGSGAKGNIAMPWYTIRDNKLYNTMHHPEGHSAMAQYEIRGDHVYATVHHPGGFSHKPAFTIGK